MMDFKTPQKQPAAPKNSQTVGWGHTANSEVGGEVSAKQVHAGLRRLKHRRGVSAGRRTVKRLFAVVVIIACLFTVRLAYNHFAYIGIDTKRYQAVYLTNDNVYFGKVQVLLNGDLFVTDVFRVQAATSSGDDAGVADNSASNTTGDIRLIKPGKELHAPDDTMLIKRNNILFIENLQTDGSVTQAIVDYHKQNSKDKE